MNRCRWVIKVSRRENHVSRQVMKGSRGGINFWRREKKAARREMNVSLRMNIA